MTPQQKCSYITLAGATNAGKSTLLNALVGAKIAIITPKEQTTRNRITGITMEGACQLVFIDTPGIFKPKKRLDKAMVKSAWQGIKEADITLLLVDAKKGICSNTAEIIKGIGMKKSKAILVINKIDAVKKDTLLALSAELNNLLTFEQSFMISALKGDGIKDLRKFLAKNAPEMPWLFPPDQVSDAPKKFLAAEITREKLFLRLDKELPYSLMVETEAFEERPKSKREPAGSIKINQVIYVTREAHKKIILGRNGDLIKEIGAKSRAELARIFGQPVHLFLFVKHRENWQDSKEHYAMMGLDFPG